MAHENLLHNIMQENKIELHYLLCDNSHTMNAFTLNKCEWELLNLFKEVSEDIKVKISIESEAISEGGIRQWFKILVKTENKTAQISAGIISAVLIYAFTKTIDVTSDVIKEYIHKNPEMEQLTIDEKKAEIEGKKLDNEIKKEQLKEIQHKNSQQRQDSVYHQTLIERNAEEIKILKQINNKEITEQHRLQITPLQMIERVSFNTKAIKRASNFYEELSKEPKVKSITVNCYDESNNLIQPTIKISKVEFSNRILTSNELKTLIDEKAIIEIISPVLKKGNYQWRGIYKGETLGFNMKSNEFKTLVQTGDIEFKNGTCITCILEMPRIINNFGDEVITAYNIIKVINHYEINSIPQMTKEGLKYTREKEAQEAQLSLFSDINE